MPVERKIGLAAFYNLLFGSRGFSLAPHHYPIIMGLEDERIESLLFMGPPGTGKSTLLDVVYALWEIGHDPSLTTLAISAGEALPQGFMSAVMQVIQHDKNFHDLFPEVKPDQAQGWSIQRGLFVAGHHQSDPDATYKAVGVASKALTGLHARLHIYDDLHDRENASSPEGRQQVKNTYYNTIMGRADPRGCRRVAAGRWWADDDLYQEWISSGDWVVLQLPAERPESNRLWFDVFVPRGLECVYTEKLTPEPEQDEASPYIRYRAYYGAMDKTGEGFYWPGSPSKRKEYKTVKRQQPRAAAINYNGDTTGGGEGVFREEDFRYFAAPENLGSGIQDPLVRSWVDSHSGIIEDAWDTALGQPRSSSMTAALTGLLVPCRQWHRGEDEAVVGKCDFHYDVMLLDLMLAHLDFGKLVGALRERHGKWHPRRVNIEEKSSGVSLMQTFRGTHIPVRGIKVPQGKLERAVNAVLAGDEGKPIPGGAASVQGWWVMGRVLGPAGAPWLERGPDGSKDTGFLKRICAFTGGTVATDEFDALVHLVTRAIQLSQRSGKFGTMDGGGERMDHELMIANDDDPRRLALSGIGAMPILAQLSENPMRGMCVAPCAHYGIHENKEWCGLHERATNGLSGCSRWTGKTEKVA